MDFATLAQECAPWVAYETMAAIVKTESNFRPLAIGVNGGEKLARQPVTKEEAVVTAKWLIANGYNIDMGLGQVNSSNMSMTNLTVEDAFEPCKNIAAAARILHGNYQAAKAQVQGEQAALHAALSAYNTGSFSKGFSNGYVQKVVNNAGAAWPDKTAQAIMPIPFRGEKVIRPVAKLHAQPAGQAVKLTAEGSGQSASETDVYSTNTQSVMVY